MNCFIRICYRSQGCTASNGVQVGFNSLRLIVLPHHHLSVIVLLLYYYYYYYYYCVITFMQGIYNYMPETTHVSRVHSVAAFCIYNLWHMQC